MNSFAPNSNTTAPTRFLSTSLGTYAYRRFGGGTGLPLLCLQHFTGTLDNWDPAVTDPLAVGREVILFESAGVGRSSGSVPETIGGMADHALSFMNALHLTQVDVLGFSLGGMVAQAMALKSPSLFRRLMFVATAPEGGEDIMHMEKPSLQVSPRIKGFERIVKLFFTPSVASQAAGEEFAARLMLRQEDREPAAGSNVARAQIAAFRAWEAYAGERFSSLQNITHPCLVVNGIFDKMIPVRNSYMLGEHLPNAMLVTLPDSGHGALFQFHKTFVDLAKRFLETDLLSF
jgi:pimeloyl-ACP methyl ester carboxylesterase